jgi:Ser-tRNA(Ala) deacylase AlaX
LHENTGIELINALHYPNGGGVSVDTGFDSLIWCQKINHQFIYSEEFEKS